MPDCHISRRITSLGKSGSGKIRHAKEEIALLAIKLGGSAAKLFHFKGEGFDLIFLLDGVSTDLLDPPDLLAEAIALRTEMLEAGFALPASGINGKDLIDQIGKLGGTGGESGLDGSGVFPEKSDVEHRRRVGDEG